MGAGLIAGIIIVIIIISLIIVATPLNAFITGHERTLEVKRQSFDASKDKSHYLVTSTDRQIIELEAPFYAWGTNIDLLRDEVEDNIGKTVTFDCFGFRAEGFPLYWYSNCYKIKDVK